MISVLCQTSVEDHCNHNSRYPRAMILKHQITPKNTQFAQNVGKVAHLKRERVSVDSEGYRFIFLSSRDGMTWLYKLLALVIFSPVLLSKTFTSFSFLVPAHFGFQTKRSAACFLFSAPRGAHRTNSKLGSSADGEGLFVKLTNYGFFLKKADLRGCCFWSAASELNKIQEVKIQCGIRAHSEGRSLY